MLKFAGLMAKCLTNNLFCHGFGQLQVIVAYAPSELPLADVKDSFTKIWSTLCVLCNQLILGDFNAATGSQRDPHRTVVGPHGHGSPGDNTERLLIFCAGGGFRISGIWFQ